MKPVAAMRDAIKRDFLTDLEASAILQVNGTPVIIAKQRTCGLCGHGDHNARTLPEWESGEAMTPKDWKDINEYARQLDWETGRCVYPENRAVCMWWQRALLPVKSFLRYWLGIPITGYGDQSKRGREIQWKSLKEEMKDDREVTALNRFRLLFGRVRRTMKVYGV
jgi:hypothetical protein